MRRVRGLFRDQRGATSIEYALICALIFLAILGAVSGYSRAVQRLLGNVSNNATAVL